MHDVIKTIQSIGLVPVIKIDEAPKAVPLGNTLVAGGIPVAEVTFRTAAAADAIRAMSAECPDLLVGAGTVINVALAKEAIAAGAKFIVSPGFNPETVDYCLERGIPILPGCNTPSLIEAGLTKGLEVFKFFPAEASGGVAMIDALSAPFGGIKFVPTGGINLANLGDYAKRDAVIAIGGSWMVDPDLVAAENWTEIKKLCEAAVCALQGFSFGHIGINNQDEQKARVTSGLFATLGFAANKDSPKSVFAGSEFEVMKQVYNGTHGHLGIKTYNIERAMAYLARHGLRGLADTAVRDAKGQLKFIYLEQEVGGFAVHLMKA